MRETNGIITRTDARLMGLYPLGATPPDSNRLVTKEWLRDNYYVDVSIYPMSIYSDLRCIKYQDALTSALGPLPNFYQYDVTRSSIPGADGGYFTYTSATGTTETILQNSYGYVGRFCMEENSYTNNQYNLYSITQVGICTPNNPGLGYPIPESPQFTSTNFTFTFSPTTHVEGFALFNSAGTLIFSQNGTYNNTFYLNDTVILPGTYFARYYIYDNSGNFIYKVGYRGYPAKRVLIPGPIRYFYNIDIHQDCQYLRTEIWSLTSQPVNFWYNWQYGYQYYVSGAAGYTTSPAQSDINGADFNASSCDSSNVLPGYPL